MHYPKICAFILFILFFGALSATAQKGNVVIVGTNSLTPILNSNYVKSSCIPQDPRKLDVIIDLEIDFAGINQKNVREIIFDLEFSAISDTYTWVNWLASENAWLNKTNNYSVTPLGNKEYRVTIYTPNGINPYAKSGNLTGATVAIVTDFSTDPTGPFNKTGCSKGTSGFDVIVDGTHTIKTTSIFPSTLYSGTDVDVCESQTCSLFLKEASELPQTMSSSIYPNPTSYQWTIANPQLAIQRVDIFAINGRLVKRNEQESQQEVTIPVYDLPNGLYLLKVYTSEGVQTLKAQIVQ